MKTRLALVVVIGLIVAANTADDEAVKKELKLLEGSWHAAGFEHNGRAIPEENVQSWTLEIKGDKYTFTIGGNSEEGTIKLDPTKKPKTVDALPTSGAATGMMRLGIYEIKDDEAKVCLAAASKEQRPTEMSSKEGSANYFWVFKKKKN